MKDLWKNRDFTPMLLREVNKPFNSKKHIFEVKFDGVRAIIFASKTSVYVQSRNKLDLTGLFPELDSIKNLVSKNVIFDGELVLFKDGKPSFGEILKRLRVKNKSKVESMSNSNPVSFMVFDILYEDKDLTNDTLMNRKKILSKYKDNDVFVKVKYIENDGVKLFNSVKKLGLEGIVAKDKDGLYHINKRTDDFVKIKNKQRDEFFVGGYEIKKNDILSLALGEYKDNKFCYVGSASVHSNYSIYNKVIKSRKSKNYFCDFDGDLFFIKPVVKCNVEYLERTSNGHLRHPIVKDF